MFPLRPAKLAAITLISVCFTLSTSVTASTTQPRSQTDWVAESTISDIAAIHDVTFADDSNGWAVGGSSSGSGAAVFVTQDGGLTWKTQITPATDPLQRVIFADDQNGYLASGDSILHTVDGGTSWQPVAPTNTTSNTGNSTGTGQTYTVKMEPGSGGGFVFSPANLTIHVGDTVKWVDVDSTLHNIVGQDTFSKSVINRTAFDTSSYSVTFTQPGTYKYECQIHLPIMVGQITVVGASAPSTTLSGITDLAAPSPSTLYATASDGLYLSQDGGGTWQSVLSYSTHSWSDWRLAFTDATDGWLTGTGLWHTTDGTTWTPVNVQQASNFGPIAFPSAAQGFLGGESGLIVMTDDGGATWSSTTLPASSGPDSADCTDSTHTYDGRVLSLAFVSPTQGLAATGSSIFATQDGGATWQEQTVPSDVSGIELVGYRGSEPFVVTCQGVLLHYGPLPNVSHATPTPVPLPAATEPPPVSSIQLRALTPGVVTAGASIQVALKGSGFDDLATISIGDDDVTDVSYNGSDTLTFNLPALAAGTYDVTVTEPDGRTATLPHALTVRPRLTLRTRLLHVSIRRGGTAIVLIQTLPSAHVKVAITTASGHPLPHVRVRLQGGKRGQWRALLGIGTHVPAGADRVIVSVSTGKQRVIRTLSLRIDA